MKVSNEKSHLKENGKMAKSCQVTERNGVRGETLGWNGSWTLRNTG